MINSLLRLLAISSLALGLGLTLLPADAAHADEFPPAPPLTLEEDPADDGGAPIEEAAPATVTTSGDPMAASPGTITFDDATVTTTTAPRRLRRRSTWSLGIEVGTGWYPEPEGIIGVTPPAGTTLFNWDANDLAAGIGARLTVTRALRGCDRLEFRGSYMGWSDDSSQTGRFGFRPTPGGALTLSPVATATLESEVDLWSLEVNWWKPLGGSGRSRFEWGFGARVVSLTDTATAKNWAGLAGAAANLEGEAQNTLWAGQAMGAWRLQPTRSLAFAVIGKALAGALNRDLTEKDTSIVTGGPTSNASTERTDFGWGLEGEVRAVWRPWSRVGITASYTVLFLDDVSRGSEIMDFAQTATGSVQILDTTDSILVHTLYLGVHLDL